MIGPSVEKLEMAIEYFRGLEPGAEIQEGTPQSILYEENIITASAAGKRLNKYIKENQLEFLASKGFSFHQSVLVGVSQKSVENRLTIFLQERNYDTRSDSIEQTLRVLSGYEEIKKYELKVEEHRRLHAVQKALEPLGE